MGANVLVEFEEKNFNCGHFFKIGGQWGQMCLWNLKCFFNWGHFVSNWGQKLFWDRENQLFWELYGPLYFNRTEFRSLFSLF